MIRLAAFWDASALVPCCIPELATLQARAYLRQYNPVVWWGSKVEVHSAVARLLRLGSLDSREADGALIRLEKLSVGWRHIPPDDFLRDLACDMVTSYALRAADSLQLAAALMWCNSRPAGRAFICGDKRLGNAARAAGFSLLEI